MNQDQQFSPGVQPQAYRADQTQEMNIRHEDNLYKFLLDSQPLITRFEHTLRGDIWKIQAKRLDDGTIIYPGTWESSGSKPGISEEAIREITNLVGMCVNNITVLSDIPQERILIILRRLWIELTLWMLFNGDKLGIDRNYRRLLRFTVVTFVEMGLRKSMDAGERNAMMIASNQRTQIVNSPEKRRGLLGRLGM